METESVVNDKNTEEQRMESLVKYSKPLVVSKGVLKKTNRKIEGETVVTNTQDILNSILPPLEWVKGGQHYGEFVLSTPATRADVIALQKDLDNKLQVRRARETGICPIREELYSQCFDELIRQVTIICSHRGLLLVRVRDEMRMNIQAYQTLYESSLAFGMRFCLKGEQNRANNNNKVIKLLDEIEELEHSVADLEQAIEEIEADDAKAIEQENQFLEQEMNRWVVDTEQLRKKLEQRLFEHRV